MPLRCPLWLLAVTACRSTLVVHPDRHWRDMAGDRIEAHGGGLLHWEGLWYWYGESAKTGFVRDHAVNAYSAPTLAGPWRFLGPVFRQERVVQPDACGPFIIERPHVIYSERTNKFVMWFHLDTPGYHYRHVGVAAAEAPWGPFEYRYGARPDGIGSLDISLFKEPLDDRAYLVRSCNDHYVGISRLSDDYLLTTGIISTHPVSGGAALFRHPNGTYYMLASHPTGWRPKPLALFRAAGVTLEDPRWVAMGNPTGSSTPFHTQPARVLRYTAAGGSPFFVYMADDWPLCPDGVGGTGGPLVGVCYTWLPICFHERHVSIEWRGAWDLDEPRCHDDRRALASQRLFDDAPDGSRSSRWRLAELQLLSFELLAMGIVILGGAAARVVRLVRPRQREQQEQQHGHSSVRLLSLHGPGARESDAGS